MIPGDHPVIQAEHDVRDAKIIETGARKPLEYRAPVIADVACKAALKWRQPLNRIDWFRRQEASRDAQGVARNRGPFARRRPPYFCNLTLAPDYAGRIGSEEGVVGVWVVRGRAVEKQHVGKVCKAFTRVGWIQCT
jgi:hypothetical protein